MITKNQTYTYIRNYLKAYDEDIFVTNSRIYASSRFPTVEVVETSASPQRENIDLSDTSYRITWECTAYSDKGQGAAEEAYELIRVVEEAFTSIGFRMVTNMPTENTKEITIKRHTARFTRIVCSEDTI